jgi:clostripain
MLMTKLKVAAALLVVFGALGVGSGLIDQSRADGPTPQKGKDSPAADTDADKKDKDKLQGTWNAISITEGTNEEADAEGQTLAFKGDEFAVKSRDAVMMKGTFKVDASKKPKTIDLKIEDGPKDRKGKTAHGIYELKDDKLTLCIVKPGPGNRPKEFASKEGADTVLLKLEREKKAPDAPKRSWTILLYGAVDNSADEPFVTFTDQVRRALDDDPGVELVLLIDRSQKHPKHTTFLGDDFSGTRLYRIKNYYVERLSGGTYFPEITKDRDVNLNSADASTLQRFIAWGKANYPAERYGLLIYSHADGKSMCPDDRSGDQMGIAELTDKMGVKDRIDFLALELCNMGGVEIAYQWRPGNGQFEADVLLAVPNAGPPLDWHRAFGRIRSPGHGPIGGTALDPAKMTAVDFGKLVIEEGLRGRQATEKPGRRGSKESAGCYDLRKAGEVKKAVDALAVALSKSDSKGILLEFRDPASKDRVMNYSGDGPYVDLYDLCRRLAGCDRLSEPVRSAAKDVMKCVERFMIASFGMSAYKQFEAGKNGVFIVLPSGQPDCWKQFRWYTPIRGDRKNVGNWSFLKDGATPGNGVVENWFELLDSWFDVADEKGGINGYRQ